jgi:hypothetical protein
MAKATSLLKAYLSETIPPNGGFIITAFFQGGSAYSIYEITAYSNVKDIYRSPEGIVFKTDGNRTHLLVEPAIYSKKHMEPVHREEGLSIPYRFSELTIISGAKSEKIMVPHEPMMLHSSFTILEKKQDYFSFIFHPTKDVYIAIKKFVADSLYNDCSLTKENALDASTKLLETIKKFSVWE